MSDQTTTTATEPNGAAPAVTVTPAEPAKPGPIPYERFSEVNERLKAAEAEKAALEQWKADQEAAKLSEIERATKAREEAEARATAAEERARNLERTGLIREAARAAGFTDPSDAVAFLSGKLDSIEDADKAKAAVTELAESKKHLLATANAPARPTPIGGLTPTTPSGDVPVGEDGQPDVKAGLGQDLVRSLLGRK